MKECFWKKSHLSKKNKERLSEINDIIKEYRAQGYRITLRQLYYQLVSRAMIPNRYAEYSKLSKLLVNGRMAGEVDWSAIEDRIRTPYLPYYASDVSGAMNDTIKRYRLDRMRDQKSYIEVWCEKDALSNILYRVTSEYHIRLMVNRGYSSCTALHDAYERFGCGYECDKRMYLLYLGDHDPSGLDMVRDIRSRLKDFGIELDRLIHVALTREQIEEYDPPPNPAKLTDPRAGDYIERHGDTSWEVDALEPSVLHDLLREKIEGLIDRELYEDVLEQEQQDIEKLQRIVDAERCEG